jgi:short subunit dehydrogenase-like uncharacterized protein
MPQPTWLLYGANGYTGRRIAREAVSRGMKPVLAGRNAKEIEALAAELHCEFRVFLVGRASPLAPQETEQAGTLVLRDVHTVLNCAGPFSQTGEPMMDACLAAGVNYLDITGEIPVIEAAAARNDRALAARVSLVPAVGFDVVPSDCLAARLARQLPGATHLQLAFATSLRMSRGTARTMLERLPDGGRVRRDGRIVRVPTAWKTRDVPFATGQRTAVTIPWGDVATAWHTTGIPNIEVYTAMPAERIRTMRRWRWLLPALRLSTVRAAMTPLLQKLLADSFSRAGAPEGASFWGRASDAEGRSTEATLETLEGYQLTVLTALAATEKMLTGAVPPGFHTPARAYGEALLPRNK